MKSYLLTLLFTSLVIAMVNLLTPHGERGGTEKHMKLLTSLLLLTLLVAPLGNAVTGLREWINGSLLPPWAENKAEEFESEVQEELHAASKKYFTEMLTQTLEKSFEIETGNIRCSVIWKKDESAPEKITVILSGKAIWKDPKEIREFVSQLTACECTVAIE